MIRESKPRPYEQKFNDLPEVTKDAVIGVLPESEHPMAAGIVDPETGSDYRGYLIHMLLRDQDEELDHQSVSPAPLISPEGIAKIYDHYGLTGEDNGQIWLQLHGHVAGTVAAATTISNRMLRAGVEHDQGAVVTAALLHDVAKGKEIKQHGELASSLANTDHTIEDVIRVVMAEEGVDPEQIERTIVATTNTGRKDRIFTDENGDDDPAARMASIEGKGIEAAIVGLADARSVHMDFLSIEAAKAHYLARKKDPESVAFFNHHWPVYYETVSDWLTQMAPHLDLEATDKWAVHDETIFPTIHGIDAREWGAYRDAFSSDFTVEAFTKGKNPERNEDKIKIQPGLIVISDGATDKTGLRYEEDLETGAYKTGGEIAASIVTEVTSQSDKVGRELVQEITGAFQDYYAEFNPAALTDSSVRFAATLLAFRVVGDNLIVTTVGDPSYRVNDITYTNEKTVDYMRALQRREAMVAAIEGGASLAQAVEMGRAAILADLKDQHLLQNNPRSALGYAIIDGSPVPPWQVRVRSFPLVDVQSIEATSDGYYGQFPARPSVASWEALRLDIEFTDPHKFQKYLSTKENDDRSTVVARRIV